MGSGQALGPPPITGDEIARILRCNLVQEFERLRGVPGFQLDPVPWETTRKLVEENTAESLGKLGRSPAGSVIYWKFKGTIDKEWVGVAEYVQWNIFKFQTELTEDGRKKVIVPEPDRENPTIVWRPNDFPYNFEEGMEHHNIWSTVPLSEEEVLKIVDQHRRGYEFVWFTNPLPLASIPSVWHAHVISRPGTDKDRAVCVLIR
ncbi:hypothetical protein COCSUDRAFT_44811 [Coccomyxa subellipsoidea C-169]|uniref:Uncharacterized protein n=1 Tax=Coccomyxa subellipsoidea (strain C-169) TaxID=574566 RepID=I0YKV2_COCSC|nr:hypothetical protein COCSUDRAFT_44811 [Coccomyxa subellipsoidea C-169]EIE19021.1 hypothetical protein COCSUDRAFT_44811 [Coccomyxa subellipsoidea C-169]|eukprot:XP_005643565.1 hypothetical protein COCSUDRAFT_44811 [Coccomyxa subellipsoidea C-169]